MQVDLCYNCSKWNLLILQNLIDLSYNLSHPSIPSTEYSTDTHSSRVRKQLKNEKSWISYLRTLRQMAVSFYIKQKEPFWELLFCAEGWKWLPELDSNQWPTG